MITSALFLFYFLTPLFIVYLCYKFKTLNKIGAIIITYLIGIISGNIGIIPTGSSAFRNLLKGRIFIQETDAIELFDQGVIRHSDLIVNQIASIQNLILSIVIPLSIPLLLFSFNPKNLKKGFLSTIIAIISLTTCVFACFFLFKNSIPEGWKIPGMMIGAFTGGTASLAVISNTLEISPNLFFITQVYALIIGITILLFLITIGQRLFKSILSRFKGKENLINPLGVKNVESESSAKTGKKMIVPLAGALGLTVLIFAISSFASNYIQPEYRKATLILLISALGLFFGLIPKINKIEKTYHLGMYFILVFCLVISSMVNFKALFQFEMLDLFLYMTLSILGFILLMILFSTIFRIDADTVIVTITALLLSPAFVPMVAEKIKRKELITTGIAIGILGITAGNFLGILIACLLKAS